MLPRNMRLSRAHFASSNPRGPEKRLVSSHFSVSLRTVAGNGGCAVVISKKVAKLSVSRHLLKRRVLAVIRPYCTKDRSLIIYARPGAAALSFGALKDELSSLLTRALP